jgi:hypothetical protein
MSAAFAEVLLLCKWLSLLIIGHALRRRFVQFKLGAHLLDLRRLFFHRYQKLDKTCENRAKQLERLQEKTARGDYIPAWHYLMAYVRLGDNEQAFASLAKATEERNWFAFQIKVNPILNPLRGDPRFEALVQKVFAPKTGSSP